MNLGQVESMTVAHRMIADKDQAFLHILPTLTKASLERLIERNPRVWSRYAGYLKTLT